jgi:hypothetical protein
MRKLVLILIAFLAVVTFIRAMDNETEAEPAAVSATVMGQGTEVQGDT